MNTRQRHRKDTRRAANTLRYGRAYGIKETVLEAVVHHGTNVVHRESIQRHGPLPIGDGPCGRAVYLSLDRDDALGWAWRSIRRDRPLVSDPCGEELWPLPMVATFALETNRALLVRGWDWDLPKAIAGHLDVPVPACEGVDEAVSLLAGPMRESGIEAIACLSPGRDRSNEIAVYHPGALTLLACQTITEIRCL
jgi:hypothetical protein